jgi:hypothetical protein
MQGGNAPMCDLKMTIRAAMGLKKFNVHPTWRNLSEVSLLSNLDQRNRFIEKVASLGKSFIEKATAHRFVAVCWTRRAGHRTTDYDF